MTNNKLTRKIVFEGMKKELSRIDDLRGVEEPEEKDEYREPLSIDVTKEVKILLSWGGGEDGFKLRFKDNDLLGGVYYMANWGEYEEVEMTEEEADKIQDFYLYGEVPQ